MEETSLFLSLGLYILNIFAALLRLESGRWILPLFFLVGIFLFGERNNATKKKNGDGPSSRIVFHFMGCLPSLVNIFFCDGLSSRIGYIYKHLKQRLDYVCLWTRRIIGAPQKIDEPRHVYILTSFALFTVRNLKNFQFKAERQ